MCEDRMQASASGPPETGAWTPVSVKIKRIEERTRTGSSSLASHQSPGGPGGGCRLKQPTLGSVWRMRSGLQGSLGQAVDQRTSLSNNTAGVRAGRDPQTKPNTGARGRKGNRRGGRILGQTLASRPMDTHRPERREEGGGGGQERKKNVTWFPINSQDCLRRESWCQWIPGDSGVEAGSHSLQHSVYQ